jgi:hypothetical protein
VFAARKGNLATFFLAGMLPVREQEAAQSPFARSDGDSDNSRSEWVSLR